MQAGVERRVERAAERQTQRDRAMRGQFGHQPVGDRLQTFILLRFVCGIGGLRPITFGLTGARRLRLIDLWLDRRFVLGTHEPALDMQIAARTDADERARTGHVFRLVNHRTVVDRFNGGLDLAEPLVDLVGQFRQIGIVGFEFFEFGLQCIAARFLLIGQRFLFAEHAAQSVGVAVREIESDLDPLPAFGPDRFGFLIELLGDEHVDQADIFEPAAIVALEQIAHDRAARFDIGVDPDELRPLVRRAHRVFGEHTPDLVRLGRCSKSLIASHTWACRSWSGLTVNAISWSRVISSAA